MPSCKDIQRAEGFETLAQEVEGMCDELMERVEAYIATHLVGPPFDNIPQKMWAKLRGIVRENITAKLGPPKPKSPGKKGKAQPPVPAVADSPSSPVVSDESPVQQQAVAALPAAAVTDESPPRSGTPEASKQRASNKHKDRERAAEGAGGLSTGAADPTRAEAVPNSARKKQRRHSIEPAAGLEEAWQSGECGDESVPPSDPVAAPGAAPSESPDYIQLQAELQSAKTALHEVKHLNCVLEKQNAELIVAVNSLKAITDGTTKGKATATAKAKATRAQVTCTRMTRGVKKTLDLGGMSVKTLQEDYEDLLIMQKDNADRLEEKRAELVRATQAEAMREEEREKSRQRMQRDECMEED